MIVLKRGLAQIKTLLKGLDKEKDSNKDGSINGGNK